MTPEAPGPICFAIFSFSASKSGLHTKAGFSKSLTRNFFSAACNPPCVSKAAKSVLESTLLHAPKSNALKTRAVERPSLHEVERQQMKLLETKLDIL